MEMMDIEKAILAFPILLFVVLKIIEIIIDKIVTKKYIIEYFEFNVKKVVKVAYCSINLYPKHSLVGFTDNGNNVIQLKDLICIKTIQGDVIYTKEQLERR